MVTEIGFLVVLAIAGISVLVSKAGGSSSESESESAMPSAGSISDRVNAARIMENILTQGMGYPLKAELMGPESTMLNLLCPDPTPLAVTFDNAPSSMIRKLKDAGFTTVIFSDQSGQSVKVVDLTK
jgi:hypothetical protein